MGSQVPLVVYKRGVRTEVGKVSIEKDGALTGQVASDHWPLLKEIIKPGFEVCIGPRQGGSLTFVSELPTEFGGGS